MKTLAVALGLLVGALGVCEAISTSRPVRKAGRSGRTSTGRGVRSRGPRSNVSRAAPSRSSRPLTGRRVGDSGASSGQAGAYVNPLGPKMEAAAPSRLNSVEAGGMITQDEGRAQSLTNHKPLFQGTQDNSGSGVSGGASGKNGITPNP